MTVCFTGHRPKSLSFGFDESHPDCIYLKKRLAEEIAKLIENGADTFYTGMAQGIDTFAAEAVLAQKRNNPNLRLIAAIPCPDQAKSWSMKSKERYDSILKQCDETVVVSPTYFNGCMHVRNRYMADRSDILLAVYNNAPTGGTASTVQYAKKKGLTVIELRP